MNEGSSTKLGALVVVATSVSENIMEPEAQTI